MNPKMLNCRKLLQAGNTGSSHDNISQLPLSPTPAVTAAGYLNDTSTGDARTPLDSSMALIVVVLAAALFSMLLFSIFHCLSNGMGLSSTANSRRRFNQKRGGLDASTVSSLPLVAHSKDAKHHPMTDGCPICLSEFRERETVKLIPYCGHVFHPICIDTWLASHVTCPVCRSTQLFEKIDNRRVPMMPAENEFRASEIGEGSTVGSADTSKNEV